MQVIPMYCVHDTKGVQYCSELVPFSIVMHVHKLEHLAQFHEQAVAS